MGFIVSISRDRVVVLAQVLLFTSPLFQRTKFGLVKNQKWDIKKECLLKGKLVRYLPSDKSNTAVSEKERRIIAFEESDDSLKPVAV